MLGILYEAAKLLPDPDGPWIQTNRGCKRGLRGFRTSLSMLKEGINEEALKANPAFSRTEMMS